MSTQKVKRPGGRSVVPRGPASESGVKVNAIPEVLRQRPKRWRGGGAGAASAVGALLAARPACWGRPAPTWHVIHALMPL
jgi:hypothetical protein